MTHETQTPPTIIFNAPKSQGIGLLLTFLFGPLGLLYASVIGGLFLIPVSFVVVLFTLGFGAILMWPIAVIWSIVAISMHNSRLTKNAQAMMTLSTPRRE